MSFTDLFVPIRTVLGPELLYGPDDKDIPNRAPRIVWDALGGRALPPTRTGGGPGAEGPLATAQWRLRAEIWGESFEAAKALFDRFVGITHRFLSTHSFGLGDWTWATGVTGRAGSVCLLDFYINAPIPKLAKTTAPLEQVNVAHKIGTVDTFTVNHTLENGGT